MNKLTPEQQLNTLIWALKQPTFWLSINAANQMMTVEAKGLSLGETKHVFSGSTESQIDQLHALMISDRLDSPEPEGEFPHIDALSRASQPALNPGVFDDLGPNSYF